MTKLFITGSTGFLGSRVRERLRDLGEDVLTTELPRAEGADLLSPNSYERELSGADTVLHMAAATGKATADDHFRVTAEGTRALVEQCRRHKVRRFLFVSSIAAKFPDVSRYPYARAKIDAEKAVVESGLNYTIVRPTIIAGRGSPVLTGLRRLAERSIVPVFGTGRVRVQPILVDDLADCLTFALTDDSLSNQTVELGGPDVVTIEQLLGEIHRALTGKPMRAMHIPLAPLLPALRLAESVAYSLMPVTVGQLSTFRFDGTASGSPFFERCRAEMTGMPQMIDLSFA